MPSAVHEAPTMPLHQLGGTSTSWRMYAVAGLRGVVSDRPLLELVGYLRVSGAARSWGKDLERNGVRLSTRETPTLACTARQRVETRVNTMQTLLARIAFETF